jgi:hypothetical protein
MTAKEKPLRGVLDEMDAEEQKACFGPWRR